MLVLPYIKDPGGSFSRAEEDPPANTELLREALTDLVTDLIDPRILSLNDVEYKPRYQS